MSDAPVSYIQAFASIITHVAYADGVLVVEEVVSLFDGIEFMLDYTSEDEFRTAITEALQHPIAIDIAGAFLAEYDIADRVQLIEVALSVSLSDEDYSFPEHVTLHEAIGVLFTEEEAPLVSRLLEIGLERAVIEANLGLYDDEFFYGDEEE